MENFTLRPFGPKYNLDLRSYVQLLSFFMPLILFVRNSGDMLAISFITGSGACPDMMHKGHIPLIYQTKIF